MRRTWLLPLIFVLGGWAVQAPAAAQSAGGPRYQSSNPAPGEFLHRAPREVSIAFSEPLGAESTMTVSDECGGRVDDGNVVLQGDEIRVGLASAPSGDYTVSYVAHSEDGSATVPGSFGFEAHFGPSCDAGGGGGHHHNGGGGRNGGHAGNRRGGGRHEAEHGTRDPSSHSSGHSGSDSHPEEGHLLAQHDAKPGKHGKEHDRKRRHHRGSGNKRSGNPHADHDPGNDVGAQPAAPSGDREEATSTEALLALGIAALFGAVGGFVLRASPER